MGEKTDISQITFPRYLPTPERTFSVVGKISDVRKESAINNKGYIDDDGTVWIYSEKGKPKMASIYPYFWFNDENKIEMSDPDEKVKSEFNVLTAIDASLLTIINTTKPNEELFDEEEINDIISATEKYTPRISKVEDFLKRLVKYTIINKDIDINRLKSKTDEKYRIMNMKSGLNNNTKMSVLYFKDWMDLLGCNFELRIYDSGEDKTDPLKCDIIYNSATDNVLIYKPNGEVIDGKLQEYQNTKEDDDE